MTEGPLTVPVDFGYREMAARRERLLAGASPALRARMLGTTPAYRAVETTHWITVDIARGERTIERLLSASVTCRLQRRSLFAYLTDTLSASIRGDPIPALA